MSHAAQDAPRLDPTHYPREYSLSTGTRATWVVAGLGTAALGAFFLVVLLPDARGAGRLLPLLSFLAMALAGVYLVVTALRFRATLDVNEICTTGALAERRLQRHEIVGFRRVDAKRADKLWLLVTAPGAGRNLRIPEGLQIDAEFRAWLATFPDLDSATLEEEGLRLEAALDALDARYGPDAARWLRRLKWPIVGGVVILFIGIFVRSRYSTALSWVALAWPWITVAVAWFLRPLFRFGNSLKAGFTDVSFAVYGPGIVLMLYMMGWAHLTRWAPLVVLCAVGAALLAAAIWLVDPASRSKPLVLAIGGCLFGPPYGYGAGMLLDVRLDNSEPTVYRLPVTGKHISSGKTTSYYLHVPAWGPMAEADSIGVSRHDYEATAVGDTICLALMKGALGIPWYTDVDCPP